MNWIDTGTWEFVGEVVAAIALVFQLFPFFSKANKSLETHPEFNSLGIAEQLLNSVKNNKWRLIGIVIIAISLVAGILQKSILFGLSTCATLNYLLLFIDGSYLENAIGSNRFLLNLFSVAYSKVAFMLMIFLWFLTSEF
jgi:hypothetical protein